MNKNWLPLGTTVLLKNGTQPIMIVGRYQQNSEGKVFDYSGVLNPQGFEDSQSMYLFDAEKIEHVTEFEKEFITRLEEFVSSDK